MARVTVYSPQVQQQAMTGAKQNPVSTGFGQAVGQGLEAVGQGLDKAAQERDKYLKRVDEAATMEADTAVAPRLAELERRLLDARGRNAIDLREEIETEWVKTLAEGAAGLRTDRQRDMYNTLSRGRRDRWAGRAESHVAAQTEVYIAGEEDAHLALRAVETVNLPVGSQERSASLGETRAMIRATAARRGYSPEEAGLLEFRTFSDIHVATVNGLRQSQDPAGALAYIDEFGGEMNPEKRNELRRAVEDESWEQEALIEIEGGLLGGDDESFEVDDGSGPRTVRAVPPVSARLGSRYGAQRPTGTHGGDDYPVPVNTPVRSMLPGIARIKNQPGLAGLYVEVDHGNGLVSQYMHLNAARIEDGQRVDAGTVIALSGGGGGPNSGRSSGPHLHVSVKRNGRNIDPQGVIGQGASVDGSIPGNRPSGPSFVTAADVEEWARQGNPSPRQLEIRRRAGMAALGRARTQRSDVESEGDRAADEWRAANPGALWSSAPVTIRNGASAGYRAREAEQEYRQSVAGRGEEGEGGSNNDLFLQRLLEAEADPELFATGRDLREDRADLGETRWLMLSRMQAEILAKPPEGAFTGPRVLQNLRPVINNYVDEVFPPHPARPRTPDQLRQIAAVNEEMLRWAEGFARQNRSRPDPNPTLQEAQGQLALLLARTRGPDGTERVWAARTPGSTVVIPDNIRPALIAGLRRSGQPINNQTLGAAYGRYLRSPRSSPELGPLQNSR